MKASTINALLVATAAVAAAAMLTSVKPKTTIAAHSPRYRQPVKRSRGRR